MFNNAIKLMFLKINIKWSLHDGKGNLNVKMSMHDYISNIEQYHLCKKNIYNSWTAH